MRDVTWRPSVRQKAPVRRFKPSLALLALLVVNVFVFWYHGDPREQVASSSKATAGKLSHQGDESDRSSNAAEGDDVATETATPATAQGKLSPGATAGDGEVSRVAEESRAGLSQAVDQAIAPTSGLANAASLEAAEQLPPYDPTFGLRAPGPVHRVNTVTLQARQTAAAALGAAGLSDDDVRGALGSLSRLIDFRRLRPGHSFKVRTGERGELVSMDVMQGPLNQVRTERDGDVWKAERLEIPVDTMVAEVTGRVESSLWDALVTQGGETAELVHQVVDVFAWEIDFYSQVFPGDTFRLLVEKRYSEGRWIGYGPVLAAEIVTAGTPHQAYIHRATSGGQATEADITYYDASGKSMRKQLLKAPLKYGHVTSGFGKRRHPVLGYTRAHNGIDYGVPTGTPVWSVGDGRVLRAGWHGGFGKLVEIRHANGWVSQYAHLSKINVRVGQQVRQKEIVGAVGTTGMSTGPHLHYGLKRNDAYVNPLAQRFDPGKALAGEELARFQDQVRAFNQRLQGMHVAMVVDP